MLPFFLDIVKARSFQTLHDHDLAQGLHFHGSFDDHDFVLGSQLCQKYKLQIGLFRFLSTVI